MKVTLFYKLIPIIFGILWPQTSLAYLSIFGFGSAPSKTSDGMNPEPASSNTSPSFTSILFGTEVNKPGTHTSSDGKPAMGGVADGVSTLGGPGSWISGLSDQQRPSGLSASPNNYPKTQTQGHSDHSSASTLPQPATPGMSLHNTHFSSNLAKDAPRVPPVYSTNTKPHLKPHQNNLQFKTVEGQTKTGTFAWMSPQGQIYDVNYVADIRPPERIPPLSNSSPTPQNSHYSYSALRPSTK